jgi:predicted metal-dependent hydrolase
MYQGDIYDFFPCFSLLDGPRSYIRETEGVEGRIYESEEELPNGWRDEENLILRARRHRIIVLSQTCDIWEEGVTPLKLETQQKYENPWIIYAPLIPLTELEFKASRFAALRQQNLGGAFYLPEHQSLPESGVLFSWLCTIRKPRHNRFAAFDTTAKLASLASPFREALAVKFSHFYGRVALPSSDSFA